MQAKVLWVNPRKILRGTFTAADVVDVQPGRVTLASGDEHRARHVIVAAGVWTQRLLPAYEQRAQRGVAFLAPNTTLAQRTIQPWAPYRQLVAFNRGDGAWVSDGTSILDKNWTDDHVSRALGRCSPYLGSAVARPLQGIRPYSPGHKPCLLEQVQPGLWVASGGAKNGTLAAGWCASQLTERLT